MNTLEVTDEQLRLIQTALDFYSRIGIGQFERIKDHPTFVNFLNEEFRIKKGPLEIGDKTERGIVVEIDPKGKWVKTKGTWGSVEEIRKWTDINEVKHSTDYSRFHETRDAIDITLIQPRNMLIRDIAMSRHSSWGIHNPNVDDSCRMAFDLIQVIRHEYWKRDPDRKDITVDSHIHFTHRKDNSSDKIICKLG